MEYFAEGEGFPKRVSILESPLLHYLEFEVTSTGDEVAGVIARAKEAVSMFTTLNTDEAAVEEVAGAVA